LTGLINIKTPESLEHDFTDVSIPEDGISSSSVVSERLCGGGRVVPSLLVASGSTMVARLKLRFLGGKVKSRFYLAAIVDLYYISIVHVITQVPKYCMKDRVAIMIRRIFETRDHNTSSLLVCCLALD
jgi:hypothetical protein